jgi:hypothetical protein
MKATIKIIIRLMLYLIVYTFLLLSINSAAYQQILTQDVKGNVIDKESKVILNPLTRLKWEK